MPPLTIFMNTRTCRGAFAGDAAVRICRIDRGAYALCRRIVASGNVERGASPRTWPLCG